MVHIALWQAVLIGLIYYFGINGIWLGGMGFFAFYRPLVAGTLVGLVLGQPLQGAIIGGTINLIYIGFISAGGSLPGDPGLAGVLGTALALASHLTVNEALALAVPIGLLGSLIWITRLTVDSVFVHWADRYAALGEGRKMMLMNVVPPQIFSFILCFFPVLFACLYGPQAVQGLVAALSTNVLHIFTVIGGMLPAIGIALNLKVIGGRKTLVFFFLGFFLVTYLKLSVVPVSIFIGIAAIVLYSISSSTSKEGETNGRI